MSAHVGGTICIGFTGIVPEVQWLFDKEYLSRDWDKHTGNET